jgi:arabinose-5-phosphate isomerase
MKTDLELLNLARNSFDIEVQTLQTVRNSLDNRFVETVRFIDSNSGRIVVTGIGKSAIVAQKIVGTLNSTGTPAIFMHAADAIHGDLGMVAKDDIVMCLSKSGETPEIKMLVPLVRQMGNTLVAIVCREDSYLAKHSDHLLYTPVDREADPNNLAPTSSTTAQMAMGDALAINLLALKNFGIADFALFHPGGSIGKQLYLRVSNLINPDVLPTVSLNASIRQVILEMTSHRMGATVVLDDKGTIAGIITDGDLRRMLEEVQDVSKHKAGDIMTSQPKSIEKSALAIKAFEKMRSNSISQLIVTASGAYVGMIHLHDLIREGFV